LSPDCYDAEYSAEHRPEAGLDNPDHEGLTISLVTQAMIPIFSLTENSQSLNMALGDMSPKAIWKLCR
jgi:hypothetical protein